MINHVPFKRTVVFFNNKNYDKREANLVSVASGLI